MSAEERSDELVQELVADLEPVRPIPALGTAVAGVVGIWLAVAVLGLSLKGLRPDGLGSFMVLLGPGGIFAGLGMMGAGGIVAGIALGIPGREGTARLAVLFSMLGLGLGAGVGTYLFVQSPSAGMQGDGMTDLTCLLVACGVALLPSVGVAILAGRAAPFRPLVLVIAAAAGAAALGAVTAQAICPYDGLRHLMLGHLLAPAAGALLLSLPLLFVLRRSGRS